MPIILATQEAEIRRIEVQTQPRQKLERPYLRKTLHKKWSSGVAQGVGPEFKPQSRKKKKKNSFFLYILFLFYISFDFLH
jgi:hypothetical protein